VPVEKIVAFFDHIRLDVAQIPRVDFPAIAPPISFKLTIAGATLPPSPRSSVDRAAVS
jgi:hypothetical protein